MLAIVRERGCVLYISRPIFVYESSGDSDHALFAQIFICPVFRYCRWFMGLDRNSLGSQRKLYSDTLWKSKLVTKRAIGDENKHCHWDQATKRKTTRHGRHCIYSLSLSLSLMGLFDVYMAKAQTHSDGLQEEICEILQR